MSVLFDKDIFRLILGHALSIDLNCLIKNYELIYNCTLTCKKWRNMVFQLFVPHYRKFNYADEQFNFDNIMYTSRLINRRYFESDNHSHYKQPVIEHDNKFVLVKPDYYHNFLQNSKILRLKQQSTNARFSKFDANRICKICSTISQTRTVCGVYLYKIYLKKMEHENAQKAKELKENTENENENNSESDNGELPDVEGIIPVDRPDIDADDLASDNGNDDDTDDAVADDDDDGEQDEDNL